MNALNFYGGDLACSTKPNTISGHFSFLTYYMFTLLYLIVRLKRSTKFVENFFNSKILCKICSQESRWQTKTILFFYFVMTMFSLITLYRTYMYGFHSLKQSLAGFFWGISTHYIVVLLLDKVHPINYPSTTQDVQNNSTNKNKSVGEIPTQKCWQGRRENILFIVFLTSASVLLHVLLKLNLPLSQWEISVLLVFGIAFFRSNYVLNGNEFGDL